MIAKNIFIYHLDNELEKLFSLDKYDSDMVYNSFKLIIKVAFLLCKDHLIIPAANYFESKYGYRILNEFQELREINAIRLISSSYNIDDLIDSKKKQYGEKILLNKFQYGSIIKQEKELILPGSLTKRTRSASADIKEGWFKAVSETDFMDSLFKYAKPGITAGVFEDSFYLLPRKMGKQAYVSDHMIKYLPFSVNEKKPNYIINTLVTREYIQSFLKENDAVCIKDIPLINDSLILPKETDELQFISYKNVILMMKCIKYKDTNFFDYINNCTCSELIELKYSPFGQTFIKEFYEKNTNRSETKVKDEKKADASNIRIGVITALPEEFVAMKKMMKNVEEVFFDRKGAGHRFFIGEIKSANNSIHNVALTQCGMGNNKAAIRATNMLTHFPAIESIIMTGIAAGIPCVNNVEKHIRLGDIVVSNGIVQYDFIKDTGEVQECRSASALPSAQLTEAINIIKAQIIEGIVSWNKYIMEGIDNNVKFKKPSIEDDKLYDENGGIIEHPFDKDRDDFPKLFFGKIASANTLLKNRERREEIKERFDALAIEMEGSGICDATWEASVGYIVVRGICDYGDSKKNDVWHNYAALTAAAFTRSLIETLPDFSDYSNV